MSILAMLMAAAGAVSGGSGGSSNSLSYVTFATGTTASITIPATAAAGDIAVIYNTGNDANTATPPAMATEPSGWTKIATGDSTATSTADAQRTKVFVKVLSSGDVSSSVTCSAGATSTRTSVLIFRPSTTISTTTAVDVKAGGKINGAAVPSQTVSTGTAAPVLVLSFTTGFTAFTSHSMSPAATGTVTLSSGIAQVLYSLQNTTPADEAITFTSAATVATLISFSLTFS